MNIEMLKDKVIAKLKKRPDVVNIEDGYIEDIVDDAINDVKDFINYHDDDDLRDTIVTPVKDLCVVRLNLTGSEGLLSSSKAGTSESFSDDIPKSIRRKLKVHRSLS